MSYLWIRNFKTAIINIRRERREHNIKKKEENLFYNSNQFKIVESIIFISKWRVNNSRESWRELLIWERNRDSCTPEAPIARVDEASRRADVVALTRFLAPSLPLPVDFSTWYQREGYTSGWSAVFPAKRRRPSLVVVHSHARIREFFHWKSIVIDPG